MAKRKFLSKCEIEKVDVIIQVVTIRSWATFNDAFEEAAKAPTEATS